MITAISITSLEVPELIPYRTLRQSVEQYQQGIFVAEGTKVVQRLFESSFEILSVLVTPEWFNHYHDLFHSRSEHIQAYVGQKQLLETIVGFNLHQGIMAVGKIPFQPSLDILISQSPSPYLFVALDGLTNSENIGVLVRNCAALGVQAMLIGESSSSPYLRRAVRNSMGTVFKMPILHCNDLVQTLGILQRVHKCRIIAAHPHVVTETIQQTDFSASSCIVFGSEGDGISPKILAACDCVTTIPMQQGVDSLNVASASAVVLYEVMRQRNI